MIQAWAQFYRSLGWTLVRIPALSKGPQTPGWQSLSPEPDEFDPSENLGVQVGMASGGLVDIDLDCPEAIALAPLFLPETATFGRAGAPRSHWIYISPELAADCPPNIKPSKIELRAKPGHQTVFPPSVHPSGEPIAWHGRDPRAHTIDRHSLIVATSRLMIATMIARCIPYMAQRRTVHHGMLAIAGALWREGWSEDEARAVIIAGSELTGGPDDGHRAQAIASTFEDGEKERTGWPSVSEIFGPLDATGMQRAAERTNTVPRTSVAQGGSLPAPEHMRPLTDVGNAERLIDDHGDDLRYVRGVGWALWDGARWACSKVEPVHYAIRSVRKLGELGRQVGDGSLTKWAHASESAGRIGAMIDLTHKCDLRTRAAMLDPDPWLLNCPNGVVDLRTGDIAPHDRNAMHSLVTAVPYDPTHPCPRFVAFLQEIMSDDRELARYLLRWLGYCLTGRTTEHTFQMWVGPGSNGKSTLVELMVHMLGANEYARKLPNEMLVAQRPRSSNEASPSIVALRGSRCAFGVETSEGQRWNEALVKELTGGDSITGRGLYKDEVTFSPTWKISVAVNHKPRVRGTDRGIWRRIHLVPFLREFKSDPMLYDILVSEAPGILATLVAGCIDWQHNGLDPPPLVLHETQRYRGEQDTVGHFLAQVTVQDPRSRVSEVQMYRAYSAWAGDGNEYTHPRTVFERMLAERGMTRADRNWVGIKIKG